MNPLPEPSGQPEMEKIVNIQAASTWFKCNDKMKKHKNTYGIFLGKCTMHLRAKLKAKKTWSMTNIAKDLIVLIKVIRELSL